MKPSVLSWVASHSAAAVLGCVIAAVTVSRQVPARDPVAPVPKKASTSSHPAVSKSGSASTVLGFKQAWERLAATPLSTIERNMLKDRLAQEWRSHDPLGLLEFLGHKHSWPAACNRYDQSLLETDLPLIGPGRLFEFARRYGYNPARYGIGSGDPEVWKAMVLALPEKDRGAAWQRTVMRLDAEPHEDRARQLYRDGRIAEFGAELKQIADPDARMRIAEDIANVLERDRIDEHLVPKLLELPEDLREAVARSLFSKLQSAGMSSIPARSERRNLARKLAQAHMFEAANDAIRSIGAGVGNWDPAFDRKEGHRENAEWVVTLPEEPAFDSVRETVFQVWTEQAPEAAIAHVPTLPAGHARDIAAAAVVARARVYNSDPSEERETKLRRLIELIADPELRRQF